MTVGKLVNPVVQDTKIPENKVIIEFESSGSALFRLFISPNIVPTQLFAVAHYIETIATLDIEANAHQAENKAIKVPEKQILTPR